MSRAASVFSPEDLHFLTIIQRNLFLFNVKTEKFPPVLLTTEIVIIRIFSIKINQNYKVALMMHFPLQKFQIFCCILIKSWEKQILLL